MAQNRGPFLPQGERGTRAPAVGECFNHYIRNSLTIILGYSMTGNYQKVEETVMSLVEHFENTGVLLRRGEDQGE